MPNIQQEDLGNHVAKLTITIAREDYEPAFQAELKKRQKSANIRGFRPGKAPLNYLKKVMGPSILSNMVFEKLQKELFAYYSKHQHDLFDLPGIAPDSPAYDFEETELQDYVFHLNAFQVPEMELRAIGADDEYEKLVCEVTDEVVQESLENFLDRQGSVNEVSEPAQEGDIVYLDLREMSDGEVLENGMERDDLMLNLNDLNEEARKELLGKSAGHVFQVNVFDLEENRDRYFVLKYLLGLDSEEIDEIYDDWEGHFEATLKKVERKTPAVLDDEFFSTVFTDGEATDEESLRAHIRHSISKQMYQEFGRHLLSDAFITRFMEQNLEQVTVPEQLLTEAVEHELERQEEGEATHQMTEEEIRKNLEKSLQQTALIKVATKKFGISISQEEIKQAMFWRVMDMYQLSPEILQSNPQFMDIITKMADQQLENEQTAGELRIGIFFDKLFKTAMNLVKITEKSVSMEALQNAYTERFAPKGTSEEVEA